MELKQHFLVFANQSYKGLLLDSRGASLYDSRIKSQEKFSNFNINNNVIAVRTEWEDLGDFADVEMCWYVWKRILIYNCRNRFKRFSLLVFLSIMTHMENDDDCLGVYSCGTDFISLKNASKHIKIVVSQS